MARPATGCVEEDTRRGSTVYALRFRAHGRRQYQRLGSPAEGWTRERAELELADTMALVRKELWRPPAMAPVAPTADGDPGFHEFSSEWFAANEAGSRPSTRLDYQWQLSNHLLLGPSNLRRRVLTRAVDGANKQLVKDGHVPLPDGLTPHELRHTFASLLVALGVDSGAVMDQLGHTDPAFTLRVYRHGMRRDAASRAALRELVGLVEWSANSPQDQIDAPAPRPEVAA